MAKLALALTLVLSSLSAFSAGTGEMSERELSNKFIATIQESKIEDQLTQSSEFKACASKSKIEKGKDNSAAIKEIEDCFAKNIQGQNPKQLEKLSEKLGLQSYGLVKSKSAEDITKYISKKINKALTGVDPDEKDLKAMIESSKFKNRNIVDQSLFFRLYQTQLGKNVLFEISKFCYQDLSPTAPGATDSFKTYWSNAMKSAEVITVINIPKFNPTDKTHQTILSNAITQVKDDSQNDFITKQKFDSTADNKDQFDIMLKNLSGFETDQKFLENFFTFCSRMIKPMCDKFVAEKDKSANPKGSKACLTQSRLEQYRKAITKTAEYLKKIEEDPQSGMTFNIADMKVYDGKGENSIDAITSISSTDIMESQSKEYKAKIENFDEGECAASPELAGCEVLVDKEQSDFEIDNINLKMSVRNAAEVERLLALKKANETDFKKYLEENGYADILDAYNKDNSVDLSTMLKSKFDGRKEAYIKELQNKVGSQQVADTDDKTTKAKTAIEEVKGQQGQLAQLVMFNNIISSSFELKNAKGDSLGRNTSGLEREIRDAKDLDTAYFEGLKSGGSTGTTQPKNNSNDNNSITGLQFLDSILGFEDKPE